MCARVLLVCVCVLACVRVCAYVRVCIYAGVHAFVCVRVRAYVRIFAFYLRIGLYLRVCVLSSAQIRGCVQDDRATRVYTSVNTSGYHSPFTEHTVSGLQSCLTGI